MHSLSGSSGKLLRFHLQVDADLPSRDIRRGLAIADRIGHAGSHGKVLP